MIISIVTPTFNAERYLGACIESVKRNACPGVEPEHIVVDGGSTDSTLEIAHANRVRVITGKDSGIFDAINKGSFASSGELLGFLGADDMLLEGALNAIANEYRRGKPRWLCGGVRWIDGNDNYINCRSAPPSRIGHKAFACLSWPCVVHVSTYIEREFFKELGGFDLRFKVAGDYDLFTRALSRSRYRCISRELAVYRLTGVNFATVHDDQGITECARIMDLYGPTSPAARRIYRTLLCNVIRATKLSWCIRNHRAAWSRLVGHPEPASLEGA